MRTRASRWRQSGAVEGVGRLESRVTQSFRQNVLEARGEPTVWELEKMVASLPRSHLALRLDPTLPTLQVVLAQCAARKRQVKAATHLSTWCAQPVALEVNQGRWSPFPKQCPWASAGSATCTRLLRLESSVQWCRSAWLECTPGGNV